MRMRRLLLLLIGTTVVLTACSGVLGPNGESRLGVIAHHGEPVVIEVPDTVQVDVGFEVSVRTYGGGCISEDGTEVQVDDLVVNVRPYDVHSGANVCTDELRLFDHRTTLTLTEPGLAEIRFHGKEMPADSVLTVARSIVVQ